MESERSKKKKGKREKRKNKEKQEREKKRKQEENESERDIPELEPSTYRNENSLSSLNTFSKMGTRENRGAFESTRTSTMPLRNAFLLMPILMSNGSFSIYLVREHLQNRLPFMFFQLPSHSHALLSVPSKMKGYH